MSESTLNDQLATLKRRAYDARNEAETEISARCSEISLLKRQQGEADAEISSLRDRLSSLKSQHTKTTTSESTLKAQLSTLKKLGESRIGIAASRVFESLLTPIFLVVVDEATASAEAENSTLRERISKVR